MQSGRVPTYANEAYTAGVTNAYRLLKDRFNQILRNNASLGRSQKSLRKRCDQISQDNCNIRWELQRQQEDYQNLTRDLSQIVTEKSQIYAELEGEKFKRELGDLVLNQCHDEINEHKKALEREKLQKELSELLLDQYRDEVEEQKKDLGEKEKQADVYQQCIATAHGQITALRAQVLYLKQRMAVGEEDICALARKLEDSNGETTRQRAIIAKLEKERGEAMDGCRYYHSQISKLKATYDELEARVNALSVESSVGASKRRHRRREKQRNRHRI